MSISSNTLFATATEAARTGYVPLLHSLVVQEKDPVLLYIDNQGAITLSTNPEFYRRTKHIDVAWHYVREVAVDRKVTIEYISTEDMLTDGLTKPLPAASFQKFVENMGM